MIIFDYLIAFWDYLVITAPYLIIGLLAAGVIHEFIDINFIKKHMTGRGFGPIFKAAIFGIPLPLCSCSVIPTAVSLRKEGANTSSTSAFLISTPESGVDSISMTYGVMDLPMTIIRPVAAFITAIIAGGLQLVFNSDFEIPENEKNKEKTSCCEKGQDESQTKKISFARRVHKVLEYSFVDLIDDLSVWLVIGLGLGAMMNFALPEDIFTQIPTWGSKLLILGFGIPFYICASASTPIAASMMLKGMSPGTALIFLLVGPATNFTNIAVLHRYIGKRGVFINVLSIAVVSLALSFVVDYLYTSYGWPMDFKVGEVHDHHGLWWEVILAAILGLLLFKGVYKQKVSPYFIARKNKSELKKKGCCKK